MIGQDSSHISLAVLFLYITSAVYICEVLNIFIAILIVSAFRFQGLRYCESPQNKPPQTEVYLCLW